MIYSTLIDRIKRITKEDYEPEAISLMNSWIAELEMLGAKEELAENALIKEKLEYLKGKIEEINTTLLSRDKVVDLLQRQHELIALYDKKDLYKSFIASFDTHSRVEEIERAVDEM
jgi:hypothetical protein